MSVDVQAIVQGVRAKDYSVQLLAKDAGAAPVPELVKLLADPDEEIRQLAVHCLEATGDASSGPALAQAALDPDPQVAMAAAKALDAVADPRAAADMLAAFDGARDPAVQRLVALAFRRVAGRAELAAMKERWETLAPGLAREGLTVPLARVGDEDARAAMAAAIERSAGPDRKRWLENAERILDGWLIAPLAKVLGDVTPLVRVGVDGVPELPDTLRACDLALGLLAKILPSGLSFAVRPPRNYSAAEIDEARALAASTTP